MKLGLLGDIHAEDERLAAALAIFERARVEAVLFVGDVVDGNGDVDRCCKLLASARAQGVRGNHERWMLSNEMRMLPRAHVRDALAPRSLALLEKLPPTREIATPLGTLLLCHGVGESDMRRLSPDEDGYGLRTHDELRALLAEGRHALVVGGHTHQRMVRRFHSAHVGLGDDASLVFVNPGTLAYDCTPCCAILDCAGRCVTFHDLEDPEAPLEAESVMLP